MGQPGENLQAGGVGGAAAALSDSLSLLPGDPPAPPHVLPLPVQLVHALVQRLHDLPLEAEHRGQRVPLCRALLRRNRLQAARPKDGWVIGERSSTSDKKA